LPYNLIPSSIVGLPGHPVKDVVLENIDISYGGRSNKEIAFIPLDRINLVPENPTNYPEFSMFGELPSWGFYVRHAEGIQFKNVRLSYLEEDFRPSIVMDDVKNIVLSSLSIPTVKDLPIIQLNNSSEVVIKNLMIPVSETNAIIKTNYK
jgi:hypothetical protein